MCLSNRAVIFTQRERRSESGYRVRSVCTGVLTIKKDPPFKSQANM